MQLHHFYEKKTPTEEGTPQFAWKRIGNYPTVEQAVRALLDEGLKDSEAKEARELLWEIRKAKEDIILAVQKAQVRAYENAQSG